MSYKVYVLGAGCSAKYCYPPAKNFVADLSAYSASLGADRQRIWKLIDDTIVRRRDEYGTVETVDELVSRADNRLTIPSDYPTTFL